MFLLGNSWALRGSRKGSCFVQSFLESFGKERNVDLREILKGLADTEVFESFDNKQQKRMKKATKHLGQWNDYSSDNARYIYS